MSGKLSSTAVMNRRAERLDSLDDFPTPPWATRALFAHVVPGWAASGRTGAVWEPAANRGLMAEILFEQCGGPVVASDVHDYGYGAAARRGVDWRQGSFIGEGCDVAPPPAAIRFIATNPPFRLAGEFFDRALSLCGDVALLLRTNWLEGGERYERMFRTRPPYVVAVFSGRVAMVKGGWDPEASTATSYAWFVWSRTIGDKARLTWIPPDAERRLSRPGDRDLARRLGVLKERPASGPLLDLGSKEAMESDQVERAGGSNGEEKDAAIIGGCRD